MPQFNFFSIFITYCDVVEKLQPNAQNDIISNVKGMIHFHNYLFILLFILSIILLVIYNDIHKKINLKEIFFKYFFLIIPAMTIFFFVLVIQPIKTLIFLYVVSFYLLVSFFFFLLFIARLNRIFSKRTNKFANVSKFIIAKFNIDSDLMLSLFLEFPYVHKIKFAQNAMISFFTLRFFEIILKWKYATGVLTLIEFQYMQSNIISLSWIALCIAMLQFFYHYTNYFFELLCQLPIRCCLTLNYLYNYSKYLKFWYLIAFIYATLNGLSVIILDLDMHDWMIQLYENKSSFSAFIECLYSNLSRLSLFFSSKYSLFVPVVFCAGCFLILPHGVKKYSSNNILITKRTTKIKALAESVIKASEGRMAGKTWSESIGSGYFHYKAESGISQKKILTEENSHNSSNGNTGQKTNSENNQSGSSSTFIGLGATAAYLIYNIIPFADSFLNLKDRIRGTGDFKPNPLEDDITVKAKTKAELLIEERQKRELKEEVLRILNEEDQAKKKPLKNPYFERSRQAGIAEAQAQEKRREEIVKRVLEEKFKEK